MSASWPLPESPEIDTDAISIMAEPEQGQSRAVSIQRPTAGQIELDAVPTTTQHSAALVFILQFRPLIWASVFQQHRIIVDDQQ
ncbi:hypothetical protein [Azotobacter chroococcum]|uniref:hypothetical protein n=1 Tax=Azotobacter chroococcum TaxID=353 RepID=UPI0005846B52|nr:hypothetical protein [Azotobacter chroococcum]ASL26376.1 hypothetical protein ACG10_08735 [Azotobacter chroococcum]